MAASCRAVQACLRAREWHREMMFSSYRKTQSHGFGVDIKPRNSILWLVIRTDLLLMMKPNRVSSETVSVVS